MVPSSHYFAWRATLKWKVERKEGSDPHLVSNSSFWSVRRTPLILKKPPVNTALAMASSIFVRIVVIATPFAVVDTSYSSDRPHNLPATPLTGCRRSFVYCEPIYREHAVRKQDRIMLPHARDSDLKVRKHLIRKAANSTITNKLKIPNKTWINPKYHWIVQEVTNTTNWDSVILRKTDF